MPTRIEWAEESWNPVTGCTPISEGCQNCYAKRMAWRLASRYGYPESPNEFDVTLHEDRLEQPLRWKKPRRIFVCSMGDLFHEEIEWADIAMIWDVMEEAHWHSFIVLTKRPGRMHDFLMDFWLQSQYYGGRVLPNVIGMVTAESQKWADERIPWLLKTPLAKRGVSIEPMLGPVDMREWMWDGVNSDTHPKYTRYEYPVRALDWVILGGETGPGARPMHPDWARGVRDQCEAARVPFFFKSWGDWCPYDAERHEDRLVRWQDKPEWEIVKHQYIRFMHVSGVFDPTFKEKTTMVCVGKKKAGRLLDGKEYNEYPHHE